MPLPLLVYLQRVQRQCSEGIHSNIGDVMRSPTTEASTGIDLDRVVARIQPVKGAVEDAAGWAIIGRSCVVAMVLI